MQLCEEAVGDYGGEDKGGEYEEVVGFFVEVMREKVEL